MEQNDWKRLRELVDQIQATRGYQVDSRNHMLEVSFKIMVLNFAKFQAGSVNIPTYAHEKQDEKEQEQIELMRLLVNFLNSASAFVSHMRRHVRNAYAKDNPAFLIEYQKKVDEEFSGDPPAQFVMQLRNHYDHYQILPVGLLSKVYNGNLKTTLYLSRDLLLRSNQFNSKVTQWIQDADEHIDISQICFDYLNKSLFVWLMKQQNSLHEEAFNELAELKRQGREMISDRGRATT